MCKCKQRCGLAETSVEAKPHMQVVWVGRDPVRGQYLGFSQAISLFQTISPGLVLLLGPLRQAGRGLRNAPLCPQECSGYSTQKGMDQCQTLKIDKACVSSVSLRCMHPQTWLMGGKVVVGTDRAVSIFPCKKRNPQLYSQLLVVTGSVASQVSPHAHYHRYKFVYV